MKWDSEKIRYMRAAAERSDYYRQIASVIVPHLKKDAHVCDAGCGLGYLSAALAPQVAQVTAVLTVRTALESSPLNRLQRLMQAAVRM